MVGNAIITLRKPSHMLTTFRILKDASSMPMKSRGEKIESEIYDVKPAVYKYKTGTWFR